MDALESMNACAVGTVTEEFQPKVAAIGFNCAWRSESEGGNTKGRKHDISSRNNCKPDAAVFLGSIVLGVTSLVVSPLNSSVDGAATPLPTATTLTGSGGGRVTDTDRVCRAVSMYVTCDVVDKCLFNNKFLNLFW